MAKAKRPKKKAVKAVKIGKYACVMCGTTVSGPVFCCGQRSRPHAPRKVRRR